MDWEASPPGSIASPTSRAKSPTSKGNQSPMNRTMHQAGKGRPLSLINGLTQRELDGLSPEPAASVTQMSFLPKALSRSDGGKEKGRTHVVGAEEEEVMPEEMEALRGSLKHEMTINFPGSLTTQAARNTISGLRYGRMGGEYQGKSRYAPFVSQRTATLSSPIAQERAFIR